MPQSVPLEASETLAFTPASLDDLPNKPVFHLRAPTPRDRRFQRRLMAEEGIVQHSQEAVRAEIRAGLKANWDAETFDAHWPRVEAYWNAADDFALQRKDDPDLEWSYDPAEEQAVHDLEQLVVDSWPPLRRLIADNECYGQMLPVVMVAVTVLDWTGLDTRPKRERGYLTLDCAENLLEALAKKAKDRSDAPEGAARTAALELFVACTNRFFLDKESAGNSPSPSPSGKARPNSNTTSDRGSSKASANSSETPATA